MGEQPKPKICLHNLSADVKESTSDEASVVIEIVDDIKLRKSNKYSLERLRNFRFQEAWKAKKVFL